MKVTNIKKIVIWALVIVNAAFLAVFLWRTYEDRAAKKEALTNLSILFDRNGINMNTDNIREGGALAELKINRDTQHEQKMAELLLGPTERADQGGGIYIYTGSGGWAEFKNGGAFSFAFDGKVYDSAAGAENTAKSILRKMGIEAASVTVTGAPGNETVDAVCAWELQPIFNARLRFDSVGGTLAGFRGTYAPGIEETASITDMSSCATSLMHFLREVNAERLSCTRITSVGPGYYLEAPGEGVVAVWRVDTENGIYYVDAVTGSIRPDTQ